MSVFEALILGIVQGLTEFLPVSSSGHLVLFQNLFGISEPMLAFDIAVHWGTLFAVFAYYRRELGDVILDTLRCMKRVAGGESLARALSCCEGARTGLLIVVATIPTAIIGLTFEDFFESLFHSLTAVAIAWFCVGIFLIFTSRKGGGTRLMREMNWKDAVKLGFVQAVAIIPGISRSGITICSGMLSGLEKAAAARFSFFMAIPAILGAGILKMGEGVEMMRSAPVQVVTGFMASLIVGYAAIAFLLRLIERDKLYVFGYYCLLISTLTGGWLFYRHLFPA